MAGCSSRSQKSSGHGGAQNGGYGGKGCGGGGELPRSAHAPFSDRKHREWLWHWPRLRQMACAAESKEHWDKAQGTGEGSR
jgi:hypothetical protein